MRSKWIALIAVGLLFGVGRQAMGTPTLPVTDGLLYQLDASAAGTVVTDGSGNVVSWTQAQGSIGCVMVPDTRGTSNGWTPLPPTYQPTGSPSGLPTVNFELTSSTVQKLVSSQALSGANMPTSVFIVQNTTAARGCGGIWGRSDHLGGGGNDKGIRVWADNTADNQWGDDPTQPANTHQFVDKGIGGGTNNEDIFLNSSPQLPSPPGPAQWYESTYWTDTNMFDQRQTWFPKNFGVTGGVRYTTYSSTWPGTALGNYYEYSNGRNWGGQISEVLVYNIRVDDNQRQAIETYLRDKWLAAQQAPASFTASPASGSTLDFGNVGVSTISGVQTVTLTNDGDLAGDVTGASVTGGFAFADPLPGTPTYSVAGKGTAVYGIQLPPQTLPGSYSGVATFTTSAGGPFIYNLTATVIAHDGDVNGDGQVSLLDYNIIKVNFGNVYESGNHWADGDLNSDGQVGLLDFNIVKAHFGHTTGDTGVTAVPEPATLSLLALAGLAALRRKR